MWRFGTHGLHIKSFLDCDCLRGGVSSQTPIVQLTALEQPRDHCGARADPEFCEDSPNVSAYCPRADAQNIGNNLVRMSLRNHSNNFDFARAQRDVRRFGHPHQQIALAVEMNVEQDLF